MVSCPCTTIAALSPTRHTSTPARSTCASKSRGEGVKRRGKGEDAGRGDRTSSGDREGGARGCPLGGTTEGRAARDGDGEIGKSQGEGTHVHGAGVVVGGDDANAFAAAVFSREFAQSDAFRRGLGSRRTRTARACAKTRAAAKGNTGRTRARAEPPTKRARDPRKRGARGAKPRVASPSRWIRAGDVKPSEKERSARSASGKEERLRTSEPITKQRSGTTSHAGVLPSGIRG